MGSWLSKKLLVQFFCILLAFNVLASTDFVVSRIRVIGLQRISLATVNNYLPVRIGQRITSKTTAKVIRELYETGFFQAVELERDGSTLIIRVVERGTIGSVVITGNKELSTDNLKEVLQQLGVVRGRVFQKSSLERFKLQLKQAYNSRGKYNARITTKVTPLTQNRIAISIHISEGRVARIKAIKIIGNHQISESTLLDLLALSRKGFFTYFTKKDQYSAQGMEASLEALRSYYLDNGFLKFKIDSSQVLLAPDKKNVFINIRITEGPKYYFSGFALEGQLIIQRKKLRELISIRERDVFSRKVVMKGLKALSEAYGEIGYGFPVINTVPRVDEKSKAVFITYRIEPGRHVYVRRISFKGNTIYCRVVQLK